MIEGKAGLDISGDGQPRVFCEDADLVLRLAFRKPRPRVDQVIESLCVATFLMP